MRNRKGPGSFGVACAALAIFCFCGSALGAQRRSPAGGAGPPDPPAWYRSSGGQVNIPSVVEGKKAGIEVGQYAPDFELQPIQPYAEIQKWLGDDAPKSIEQGVKLSQFVGKAPIMLFFGSYT